MKTTNETEINLVELSFEEHSQVNGGESAWYWLAYGIGATGRFINDFVQDMAKYPQMPYSGAVH